MRKIVLLLASILGVFGATQALAQTPVPIPVTGNLGSISGLTQPYAGVMIQLQNCPSPVSITGYMGIVQQTYQIQANSSGAINSTIWPNNLITCNGTTGNSQYSETLMVGGVPSGSVQCYQVTSTQGVWNLNTQQPIACGYTPPAIGDATYVNLTSSGFFQGNNGDFTGRVEAGSILLDTLPTACVGQYMTGLSTTLEPICSALPVGVASFDGRTGAVVPVTGDYTWSMISGTVPIWNQSTTGNAATATSATTASTAATATALAATPAQCSSGTVATGIAANGNANCSSHGIPQTNNVTGCSFPNDGANLSCTNTVTLATAMPDTGYYVNCTEYTNGPSTVILGNISTPNIISTTQYSFTEMTQGSSSIWPTYSNYGKSYICDAVHP